ncbi:MAG: hypothetical protein CVT97_03655 [Bacteroidetes bacterium HGW-Bacteroidetes-14]|jgi:ankyrin repeat protein|nr:MAG: hypothetical protein CVT97_03655 [Bacteroidetes bacterium HGW-Bacteroidetes-14]
MNDNIFSDITIACSSGNLDAVKRLTEGQPILNAVEKSGISPLHLACEGGHLDVVKFILQHELYMIDSEILARAAAIARLHGFEQIRSYVTLYYIKYCRKSAV